MKKQAYPKTMVRSDALANWALVELAERRLEPSVLDRSEILTAAGIAFVTARKGDLFFLDGPPETIGIRDSSMPDYETQSH